MNKKYFKDSSSIYRHTYKYQHLDKKTFLLPVGADQVSQDEGGICHGAAG